MLSRQKVFASLLLLACGALVSPLSARADTLVELDDIRPEKLFVSGFVLDGEQTVNIEAVGFRYRSKRNDTDTSPAWILDSESRRVVWKASKSDSKRASRYLREYRGEVTLPAGSYEVYFSSYPQPWDGWRVDGLADIISRVVRDNHKRFSDDDYEKASRDFFVKVSGEGRTLGANEIMDAQAAARSGALLSLVQVKNEHYESHAITLEREMDLEIYAVGEMDRNGSYDTSWIVDTKTNKRVWRFDRRNSDPAGGAKKNRRTRETITLPAGEYALFCVTDDSHSFGKWNMAPPHDPFYWGVTVRAADPGMNRYASVGDYENLKADDVFLELIELDDSDHRTEGFHLNRSMKLRVYAIGEGDKGAMHDYSWIIDADTRDTVWEMKYRHTDHAGGASKNRMVDEIIELEEGNYIAYAVTDGSHSYRDWNASAPYDKKHWGLTLSRIDGRRHDVESYEDSGDRAILAQIVGVGDNDRERDRFTVENDGKVRIYAIGEGERRNMFDYAWIEDDHGKVVWEMTYRMTKHAGGAKKNRVFNDTIRLDRGEYTVYFESDGSHSFEEWNAKPPRDPWGWGVTIKSVE